MDEITLHETFNKYNQFVRDKALATDNPYWFYNEAKIPYSDALAEEWMSFCQPCLLKIYPNPVIGEHYGGGYECESDGVVRCEECGQLLSYSLTDYGVNNELAHFVEADTLEPLTPEEYCELSEIANGIHTDNQRLVFVQLLSSVIGESETD